MLTWFANNPWPIVWILFAVMVLLAVMFGTSGRAKYLGWIAALLVLAAGVLGLARWIDTDVKQIDHALDAIVQDIQTHRIDAAMQKISPQYNYRGVDFRGLKSLAESWNARLTFDKITLASRETTIAAGRPDRATSKFSEKATIRFGGSQPIPHYAHWELHWERSGGKWRIVEIHYIMPGQGELPIPAP